MTDTGYIDVPGLSGVQLTIVDSMEEVGRLMSWLGERRHVLAFDLETDGLDPYASGARIRLAQIGDENHGWTIPFERWGGVFLEAMRKYDRDICGHNAASFDIAYLEALCPGEWKTPWHRFRDTLTAAQIDDPSRRNALKSLATSLIDKRAGIAAEMLSTIMKQGGYTWDTIPLETPAYGLYGAMDCVLSAKIDRKLDVHNRFPEAFDLEMAARRVYTNAEIKGIRIDVEYCEKKFTELSDYVERAKLWGKKTYNRNLTSPGQLVSLFESLGGEITERTKKGAPSVNKTQIAAFKAYGNSDVRQLATLVSDLRKADKLASTYFKNYVNKNYDGIIHGNFRSIGARTLRSSSANPNWQNLPRGDRVVRDAVIPRDEDHCLISSDSDQIELRLFAMRSNDKGLIDAFRIAEETGEDFFTTIGKEIYRDPNFSKKDQRRNYTKATIYSSLYGAQLPKIALTAGISEAEMGPIVKRIHDTYPGIERYMNELIALGERRRREEGRGYITTPLGTKIYSDNGSEYTLCNFSLQSEAAIRLKQAIVSLDNAGYGEYIIAGIHDEVLFDIPKEGVEEAMKEISELMTHRDGFEVPLTASAEGPFETWGQKYSDSVVVDYTDVDLSLLEDGDE